MVKALSYLPLVVTGCYASQLQQRDLVADPSYPYDASTTKYCTFWWDNSDGAVFCEEVPTYAGISLENWLRWNPVLRKSCANFAKEKSYCVEATTEPKPTISLTKVASSTTSTKTTTTTTTSTKPNNGITTPTPTQPGMVDNCNKFYYVRSGETCDTVARNNGITVQNLASWNAGIGDTKCTGLWADAYACVNVIGRDPTPISSLPPNAIQTPSPTQRGMIGSCSKFYKVRAGDGCWQIAKDKGIALDDLYRWNPAVKADCSGLQAETYLCVGIIGFSIQSKYHRDCTGDSHNAEVISMYDDGVCMNTDCQVASLEIASGGACPGGQVQVSYWEQSNCQGKWFGYGYSSTATCRTLWTDGWKFKSLHLRCAKREDDCVSKGSCKEDPEPVGNVC